MSAPAATPAATVDIDPEDQARANHYALLARLLIAGPDAALLRVLAAQAPVEDESRPVPRAWRQLALAAANSDAAAVAAEYDTAFVGVGQAPVTPYLSHYLVGVGPEIVLVDLRDSLVALGLTRDPRSVEPEDHVAALLEVMRHLCDSPSVPASWERQRAFFARYLQPGYRGFCDAARANENIHFYRAVADLLEAFLDNERTQFEFI
jgi:TorA maturation chaperone TorD